MHVVRVERLLLLLSVFCSSYPLARPSLPPPVQLFPFFIILVSMVWVGFFILTNWYTTFDIFLTEVGCTHSHMLTDSRTSALSHSLMSVSCTSVRTSILSRNLLLSLAGAVVSWPSTPIPLYSLPLPLHPLPL